MQMEGVIGAYCVFGVNFQQFLMYELGRLGRFLLVHQYDWDCLDVFQRTNAR